MDWKIAYFTLSPGNYTWALGVQEQVVVHLEAAGCRTKRIRFHRASCSATGAALSSVPSGVTVALSGHAGVLMAALPCASFTTCGLALGYWFGRRRRAKSRTVISLRGTPSRMSKPHRLSPLERVGLVASIATIVTPFITVWALLLAHADAKAIPQRPTQETSSAPAIFSPTVASPEKPPTPPSK